MSRPVVVYVLRQYPQLSQTFVRNEISSLRATGVDVRVFSLRPPDGSVDPAWGGPVSQLPTADRTEAVRHLGWWMLRHPRRFRAYAALVRRLDGVPGGLAWRQIPALARTLCAADVVGCHTHFAWVGLVPVVLLSTLLAVPSSATVHARDIYRPAENAAQWLAAVDRLVTVCRFNVDHLHRTELWPGQVDVVPCGVELPETAPALDLGAARVVTVGRLVEKKGMLTLLEALAVVRGLVPSVTLDVVGDGPQRADVEAAVERLALTGRVNLLGALGHAESLAAIDRASVFALACQSDAEGDSDAVPVVLREAMARSKPVVTTAVAGIPEVVDSSTGWLVPPGDVGRIAAALVEALTDEKVALSRGLGARERTRVEGTVERSAEAMRLFFGMGLTRSPSDIVDEGAAEDR